MLPPDLCAFLEAGHALIVGTVDDEGAPCASRAWGCRIIDPAGELRVLIGADDTAVATNLGATQRIAVTATDPLTLRSAQLKGHARSLEPPSADDRARSARYVEAFFDAVTALDAVDLRPLKGVVPAEIVAVEVVVEELYDQTPGPSAGSRLAGSTP